MLEYDPQTSLRHWPLPMHRFGTNPYGENLYRIVFSPSRRSIVYGEWPDGSRKAVYSTRYAEVGDAWIMERWIPAEEYARCTREIWDRTLSILGPYPERGEYEICHVFEACSPTDANIEKLISWIEESRKRSYWENRTACYGEYERDEHGRKGLQEDIIRNALPYKGSAPLIGYGGGRGSKTAPIVRSANELRLPTGNNKFVQMRKPTNAVTHA